MLQAIKFVKLAVHRHVRDEVEGVTITRGGLLLLNDEGVVAGEGVVHLADGFLLADGVAALFVVDVLSEVLEILQLRPQLNLTRSVHQNRKNSLRRTRIIDRLVSEE